MSRKLSLFLSLTLVLALATAWLAAPSAARAGDWATQADYPLVGDDGQQLPNHTVRLLGAIDRLPGVVVVGNPHGAKTLTEFYDLNCPYCRQAARGIDDMIKHDRQLKLVLVPYPVLGVASVAASRVELAVAKLGTPQQFYAFHLRMYAQRGRNDGLQALAVARRLGFNRHKLETLGDSAEITRTMKNLVSLGDALGLVATPSFIVGGVAILGYPGPHALQAIVDAVAACGRVICQ